MDKGLLPALLCCSRKPAPMKHFSAFLTLLLATNLPAQSWSYVGGYCALPSGSAEMEFRSDGSAVAVSFEPFALSVRAWNGSAWSSLPAPAGVSGLIGGFDLEMQNDVAYLAVSNTQLKVYRLDGGNWTALGSGITGTWSTNYDFIVDDTGVPKVMHGMDRKVHVFDGTAWTLAYTLPQGSFPNIFSYGITGDHTVCVDASNRLVYMVGVQNKQMLKAFDGTAESVVGDTIIAHVPFYPYQANIFRNGSQELFVTMQRLGVRPFIKRLNGASWTQFGDSTGSALGGGNMLLAFRSDDFPVLGNLGSVGKRVYGVDGSTSAFAPLDTLYHSGFAQITDIDTDPTDGSVHVTFNCLPTAAVMRYIGPSAIDDPIVQDGQFDIFPNPAADRLRFHAPARISLARVLDTSGRVLLSKRPTGDSLEVSSLPAGMYVLELISSNGSRRTCKWMKE